MPRLALVLSLLVFAALPAAAGAKVRKGPSGRPFYTPPRTLVAGAHGSLIWARGRRLLYRSTGVDGKRVAVSGTLQVPKGRPPRGGWPLITWAHGTTGIADRCAPSRGRVGSGPALLERWRQAGYAIVKTDYVGLGTPGDHPYLIGKPEGYSVLDAARAARRLDKRIAKRVLISGHSQGGRRRCGRPRWRGATRRTSSSAARSPSRPPRTSPSRRRSCPASRSRARSAAWWR